MIRTLAVTTDQQVVRDLPLEQLSAQHIVWYWMDFDTPTEAEGRLLSDHFQFHPLAIEDCFHYLQRPKLDRYEGYHFYVLHALNQLTLDVHEVDLFVGSNYVVSFHLKSVREIEGVWAYVLKDAKAQKRGPGYLVYLIMDALVDNYFPALYQIEEHLNVLEENENNLRVQKLMDHVFDTRHILLRLRRTVFPMRDLVYRILNSDTLEEGKQQRVYFTDVYDHLLKLAEMIEGNRDMTADMRDSYLSLNSNRMNTIMMTLTVITTIFMPLTVLTGIYGMNFDYMPELHFHYGYFILLGIMAIVVISMAMWFKRKGWFGD
ncbi:MAG: magnesium/cobalt transporter CorA [Tumebacillaceae bacterium]